MVIRSQKGAQDDPHALQQRHSIYLVVVVNRSCSICPTRTGPTSGTRLTLVGRMQDMSRGSSRVEMWFATVISGWPPRLRASTVEREQSKVCRYRVGFRECL